jgi:hypothetical protein
MGGFHILGPLFPLGEVYLSAGATALALDPAEIDRLLNRHHYGDWRELGEDDKRANDLDLKDGGRPLSQYDIEAGSFYVITEWDRSMTTLMLREKYLRVFGASHTFRGRWPIRIPSGDGLLIDAAIPQRGALG